MMKKSLIVLLMISASILVFLSGFATSQTWVQDFNNCPVELESQTCGTGTKVCGNDGGTIFCNSTSYIDAPSSDRNRTSEASTNQGGLDGGYVINCEGYDGSEPYCTNNDNYWCNLNSTCDSRDRVTKCLGGSFGSSTCAKECQSGYATCSDVNTTDPLSTQADSCNVNFDNTEVRTINSSYNTTNNNQADGGDLNGDAKDAVFVNGCTPGCPGNWIDTNNDLTDGCEVRQGADCTTNGVSGTINSNGVCVADKKNFKTGDFEEYDTTSSEDAMLWFRNADSDGDLINATNSIGESWRVNNNSCIVLKDNTTICDKGDVGGNGSKWNLSGNYLYNNSGDLALNETELNNTIDSRSGGSGSSNEWIGLTDINSTELNNDSGTLGLNMSFLTGNFLQNSDEENLNVNSSDYWDGIENVTQINVSDINNDQNFVNSSQVYWNRSSGDVFLSNLEDKVGIGTDSPSSTLDVNGSAQFGGTWEDGGAEIEDGDVYAQTGYFYNISSINVSTLSVNGSQIPSFDDTFDLGNSTNRWRSLNVSQDASVGENLYVGSNITQDGNDVLDTSDQSQLDVNSSEILRTSEGNIDDVSDIEGSDITNDLNWINGSEVNDTNLSGESAGGDLDGTYPDPSVNWTTGNYEILLSEENITDENWLEDGQNNVTFLNHSNEGNINVTSGYDFCIEGGNCLSEAGTSSGGITSVTTDLSPYLLNGSVSGDVDLNFDESRLNSTIDDRDDYEANTEKSGSGTYLYNNSDSILLNGTQLNDTIDSRDDIGGFGGVSGAYLFNSSGDIDFNETLLNSTIDVKIDDSAFTSITGNYLVNSSGVLDFNETYLNNTIDSRSSGATNFWNLSSGGLYPEDTNYNASIGTNKTYGNRLQVNGSINASGNVTADNFVDSDGNVIGGSGSGAVPSAVNLTSSKYTGNITNGSQQGYSAANQICNQEFSGSHLCNEFEIIRAYESGNVGLNGEYAWITSGGSKYPSGNPVNDCAGFTSESSASSAPQGNYWYFNSSTGGEGAATSCASPKRHLACCSY